MVLFSATVPPPTPLVDGADPQTTGTPVNQAWYDAVDASLDKQLHSATDPTKYPSDSIAELATARGSFSNLNARLNNVVDSDGNPANVVLPSMLRNGFVHGNLLANDTFMMWSRGDAAAPDYWALSGTGAAIARCGVGQADTQVLTNQDHFSARLTYGSAPAILSQFPIPAAAQLRMGGVNGTPGIGIMSHNRPWDGNGTVIPGYAEFTDEAMYVYGICWVLSSGTNRARVAILGSNGGFTYSEYHSGGNEWELKIVGPIDLNSGVNASSSFQCRVETAGTGYFQGACLIATPQGLPPCYVPARVVADHYSIKVVGNPAAATLDFIMPDRPVFILGAQMACVTAPTTSAPTIDLLTPIGGAFVSLFTTLPNIAVTKVVGTLQVCDPAAANYRRRTIRGLPTVAAAAMSDNSILKVVYVDDAGNTLVDLIVTIHYLRYARPFEQFRAMGDIGEA